MILVFGSINIDVIGHAPRLMAPGETVLGTRLDVLPGGKGANQALAAARAGAEVRMVGCVGNDDFAGRALALLADAGVDLSLVRRMGRHTGTALIVVADDGENMITVLPGANTRLSAQALAAAGVGAGDLVLFQLETPPEATLAAARLARRRGARTILNLAPVTDFPEALLAETDILVVNRIELAATLEKLGAPAPDGAEAVAWLARRLRNTVIATLGAHGARASVEGGDTLAVPALAIDPIDTVGAGDTFVGYLAALLAEGADLESALAHASAAAGLACLAPGAQPAIPDRAAVAARLALATPRP